jgi:hypothetical protein
MMTLRLWAGRHWLPEAPAASQIPASDRPALGALIIAMERLARAKRNEIARLGRRAKAAKVPRLRRLAREAKAEAKRLAGVV